MTRHKTVPSSEQRHAHKLGRARVSYYNFGSTELRYKYTDEDALNAYRTSSKQPWTMFPLYCSWRSCSWSAYPSQSRSHDHWVDLVSHISWDRHSGVRGSTISDSQGHAVQSVHGGGNRASSQ